MQYYLVSLNKLKSYDLHLEEKIQFDFNNFQKKSLRWMIIESLSYTWDKCYRVMNSGSSC